MFRPIWYDLGLYVNSLPKEISLVYLGGRTLSTRHEQRILYVYFLDLISGNVRLTSSKFDASSPSSKYTVVYRVFSGKIAEKRLSRIRWGSLLEASKPKKNIAWFGMHFQIAQARISACGIKNNFSTRFYVEIGDREK
jgi:hypothetical protein